MNKKKKGIFWILIAIGVIILFVLILLSSVLNIGDRLHSVQISGIPFLEYGFYLLCAILIWFLLINPVLIILFSPTLSITTTLEQD